MPALEQGSVPNAIGIGWILLERLGDEKLAPAAAASGIDKGTLCNFKNNKGCIKAGQLRLLLQHLGLKIVPAGSVCVKRDEFESLTRIAGRALQERPQLFFEDDPE
jgi:hypothetical protein